MIYGINNDRSNTTDIKAAVSQEAYNIIADAGFKCVRYTLYMPYVFRNEDWMDFSLPDIELSRIKNAGLDVFVSLMWLPDWMTGGKPSYMPFECSTTGYDENGAQTATFDRTKPHCVNPPSINTAALRAFVKMFLLKYPWVKYLGIWNEGNHDVFFPPRKDGQMDYDRYINELIIPFTETVREFAPTVKTVGPEMDFGPTTVEILKREGDKKWFDILSKHPYAWSNNFPYDSILRTLEMLKAMEPYRKGREIWITELGGNAAKPTQEARLKQAEEIGEYISTIESHVGDKISRVFFYRIQRDKTNIADHGFLDQDGKATPVIAKVAHLLKGVPVIEYCKPLTRDQFNKIRVYLQKGDMIFVAFNLVGNEQYIIIRDDPVLNTAEFKLIRRVE
jgi:hypothetical protein